MHVEVIDSTRSLHAESLRWITDRAIDAARHVAGTGARGEVRVRIVNDHDMTLAHAQHCGLDSTTDVLTFDLRDPLSAAANLTTLDTDVIVCLDEARRQALDRGHAPEREILLYVIHAMLHCLGYDDHDGTGYRRMHAEEDRVLETIGVGRTFNNSPTDDPADFRSGAC